jgi:hypothetical protein
MSRAGDYFIFVNFTMNLCAIAAYAYQGHWKMAGYYFAAAQLNAWLITLR